MSETQKKPSLLGKIFKIGLVLFLVAILAIGGIGVFILDGKFDVSREITIKAPPSAVYAQVGDLREWPNWLPFTKHDKTVQTTIEQPTGVGANQHWTSKNGNGKLTITESDEKAVKWDMLFDEKYASKGSMTFTPSGDETRVVWRMTGQNDDFLGKWMALATGPMVGPMFEEGLADLKTKVEAK